MKKVLSLLLSMMMVITMSTGLDFSAYAQETARVYIGSVVDAENIELTYSITCDGEAISTTATGALGDTYEVTNGTLIMPCSEKAYIELPVGSTYSISREAYNKDSISIDAEEAVTDKVISNTVYIETAGNLNVDIGDSSFSGIPKEITKEEYDAATNNGTSTTATYYFYYSDAKNNDLETRRTADEVEVCTPVSLTSGTRYRLTSEKKSYKYAKLNLTSNTQVTEVPLLNKSKYVITGDVEVKIGDTNTKTGKYVTLTADTFEEAREKAVTNSKAALKTAILSAVSDAFKTEGMSVASEINIDTIITPDIFVEANTGGNILKTRTLGLFEFSPYIAVNYTYSTDTDYDRNIILFGAPVHTHEYKDVVTEPTCTKQGYTTHTCECGEKYIDSYTEATGHSFEENTVPPTCTQQGYTIHTCKCGESYTDNYKDATGHSFSTSTTAATLIRNGKIVTSCSKCGASTTEKIYCPKTVDLSATEYTYNGKTKTPTVTVVDTNGDVITPDNYTVNYPKGRKNVGKYKVTVAFKGIYSGTKTVYFTISPKSTSISKISAGKKSFTVKWKKQTKQITGYQIQYSTSKNFSSPTIVTVKGAKEVSKKITGLKSKKKYYVRVRTYKTVNKTKYYSSWTKTKSIKTK